MITVCAYITAQLNGMGVEMSGKHDENLRDAVDVSRDREARPEGRFVQGYLACPLSAEAFAPYLGGTGIAGQKLSLAWAYS